MQSRASTQPALEGIKAVRNILQFRELQLKLDYSFRSTLATLIILLGTVMVFAGLHGSFDCGFEAPHVINVKLTNASPGIVFVTIGMILVLVALSLPPIKFQSGDDGTLAIYHPLPLRPEAVAQIEFLELTDSDRLRHSKFVGLREDKDPRQVVKEHVGVI
jgi:hypothetical protein